MEPSIRLLLSLPIDGTPRDLDRSELSIAHQLHERKLLFMSRGLWPFMRAALTFEGRKVIARLP